MTYPSIAEIRANAQRLAPYVHRTPTIPWAGAASLMRLLGDKAAPSAVFLKLELFQRTGTFKARGALTQMLLAGPDAYKYGVTAVSAGNHAIAVADAARQLGTSAKVVMIATANPARVAACRAYGAEVIFEPNAHAGFARVEEIRAAEGRLFVHPFEGHGSTLGSTGVGLEVVEDLPDVDAVIVPIGGGGLASGVACAVKRLRPEIKVFGVEPVGADSMYQSLQAGKPVALPRLVTIADSLGAPGALPYSFGACQQFLDEVVLVSDDELRQAMRYLAQHARLAVEPAGAASTAALCFRLRERLADKRVALIICGSNIDTATYCKLLAEEA